MRIIFQRWVSTLGLLVTIWPGVVHASVFGTVKAIVHDPQHRPVQSAQVVVESRTSAFKQTGATGDDGIATVMNVPVGQYAVTVTSKGFAAAEQTVNVASDRVQELHFALTVAVHQETLEVSGAPELVNPSSSTPTTLVSRDQIAKTPGADRTNSLAMITDFTPGAYMVHDQLHVRGGHQVTWAIDGVPVPNTNIASNVGPQFDPKDIDYVEVQRGSFTAEYGDRAYGVFNVATRTGFERSRQAELVTSYGSYNSTDNQLSFGDHNDRSAYYVSANGYRTDHGLATPTSANLHNLGDGGGVFTSLIFNTTPNDQLRFVGAARADYYQVPNSPDDQAAGIRDHEREQDIFGSFSWLHTIGPGMVFSLTPSYHFNRAAFEGEGAADSRVITTNNRASSYLGGQATFAIVRGRHNAKVGFYGFAQHDNTLFGLNGTDLTQPPGSQAVNVNPPRQKVNGDLEAVFVEDQFKAASWLVLNGGVRFIRFSGVITEAAVSPRLGVAIQIPRVHWVLRGSYSRFYQAPPLDSICANALSPNPATCSLLQFAENQGVGFLPLRGERDEQYDFGVTVPIRSWAVDVDTFRTGAHNFFDHDVIGNSNLFFPLTIEAARIRGTEVTLRAPRLFKKVDVHLAYSHQSAAGSGAITGGLTDFSPPASGFFLLDHDQRNTLSTGFTATLPKRSWISGNVVYGSGFLNGDGSQEPTHLPSYATFDLAVGKSFGENWEVRLTGTNLANKHYFVDLSNTFGGSHFADPRMVSAQVRYRFHY
jgi:outer membrane receptor protein involved in Fe transport